MMIGLGPGQNRGYMNTAAAAAGNPRLSCRCNHPHQNHRYKPPLLPLLHLHGADWSRNWARCARCERAARHLQEGAAGRASARNGGPRRNPRARLRYYVEQQLQLLPLRQIRGPIVGLAPADRAVLRRHHRCLRDCQLQSSHRLPQSLRLLLALRPPRWPDPELVAVSSQGDPATRCPAPPPQEHRARGVRRRASRYGCCREVAPGPRATRVVARCRRQLAPTTTGTRLPRRGRRPCLSQPASRSPRGPVRPPRCRGAQWGPGLHLPKAGRAGGR